MHCLHEMDKMQRFSIRSLFVTEIILRFTAANYALSVLEVTRSFVRTAF